MSSKSFPATAAAVVVATLLFAPAVGHARLLERAPARAADVSSVHIDNFGQVNPAYYRGAEPDDDQYAALALAGIKTVVDLRSDDVDVGDKRLVEQAGMQYARIPMTTHQAPTPSMVETFLKMVNEPANQPVYVHCVGGRHRTGVMTAIYRITHDRWTADQAFKEMKQYKFGADFLHSEFKKFVYAFRADPRFAVNAEQ